MKHRLLMSIVFLVIATVMLWTNCHSEWMVSYATSIAQLSLWITAISLINFWSLWISIKNEGQWDHVNLRSMIK